MNLDDLDELKAKLEGLDNEQKAALMAPALIYIGKALDEFGCPKAAIKVAEAASILIANMTAVTPEDHKDQKKTIAGLSLIIAKLREQIQKEH